MDKDAKIKSGLLIVMAGQLTYLITVLNEIRSKLGNGNTGDLGFSIFILIILFAALFWDKVKYTKKCLLVGNIFLFILVPTLYLRITTIINILLLIFVKSEKREKIDFNEIVNKLTIENKTTNKKRWILMIIFLVIYFGQNFIQAEWLEPLSLTGLIIYAVGLHLVLIILAIWAFFDEIKEGAKKIAKNFRLTIRYILKLLVWLLIALAIASSISVMITKKNQSMNQEAIESLPLYITIPLAVIWAPFVEEAAYRGAFKKVIKNKLLFVILSGGLFGLMHAIGEATFAITLATAMPYVVIGMVFAYSYAKTNNLAVNILFHLLYNSLAVLASMLK